MEVYRQKLRKKMRKTFYCLALFGGLLLAGCASYQKTAPLQGMNSNTVSTYAEADIDYSSAKKVSGTIETKKIFGFNTIRNGNKTLKSSNHYGRLSKREAQALYKAKESADVDLILDPEFETEKHSYFFGLIRNSTTKVTGWGVKIKGMKDNRK